MIDFKQFRKARTRVEISALELARGSKIDRSRISLYESGTAQLSEEQLEALCAALVAAIRKRIKNFEGVIDLLRNQKEAVEGVGARIDGRKEDRCGEHSDQP